MSANIIAFLIVAFSNGSVYSATHTQKIPYFSSTEKCHAEAKRLDRLPGVIAVCVEVK
jgi:hypothetical protein